VTNTLYRMFDENERLLYVGITLDVGQRFTDHRQHKPWWQNVVTMKLEHFATRAELEAAERDAIVAENPLHNRQRNFRPETSRESTRRQRKHLPGQRKLFTAIRRYAHQPHDGLPVQMCIRRAREGGVGEEDIQWALAHPSYAPPP
jgi:predicted GIY-YIG superfamily endonuclease